MTFACDPTQLMELSRLYTFLGFFQKRNFLERQETKVSSREIHMTFFVYVEHPPLDQLSLVVGWPVLQF